MQELEEQGKTAMALVYSGKILGLIAVADTIKEDSVEAISELRKLILKQL